ncbi:MULTISPECIES: stomatin-like protein [unclassified Campylobacter]|uniref:SPFH domain-containing protein n=1 Tax=unclassified Campylobacter TaxID=2593542 RepID=UPI001BD9EE7C|nr:MULTISPECIES: stomatin-like protein [unclassified Campylobacter]MBZ7975597.1 paraslipin [Campylobacter sp. RM12637]MBZ7977393.1 paraslipin [Campylobacter sp. RM12654]MBZ7979426.1 paraslipin [Campylobacter sp. RM12642]MBZ7980999.1 paraslipin [Campylobacter sp. RM12640]MBZ7988318.1 paraslipin [Campylobacter sp. RM12635]MBZ7990695.1 paraslipin [Campylobacter sp. RM9331]MBZ8005525.1 paraslipin [Campylobacter sp. RM9332]MBZ8006628.1 paraslipin [Campylobacter sp. RM9334]
MMEFLIFVGVLLALIIVILIKSIIIVSQSDIVIVERLGKFHKELSGGFHLIFPFIDMVKSIITIKEQLIDIEKQQVITKDNVNILVDGIVFLKVTNGKMAFYNVENYKKAISNLAMTTLRGEIGGMYLDDTLSSRDSLNSALQIALGDAADNWGVKIMRVEISEISVPSGIEEAMNLQMKAEREKRAIELNAEAQKVALIKNAEALKQEQVLNAEAIERMADAKKYEQIALAQGQKEAMNNINEAMAQNINAAEFLLAKGRVEAFLALAKSENKDKILVPYESTELIGALSVLKEFVGKK